MDGLPTLHNYRTLWEESDEYAEIDLVNELNVYFKYVPRWGNGFVNLKNPEAFPEVLCPETQAILYNLSSRT